MRALFTRFAYVLLIAMLTLPAITAAQDITDTLFYDIKWQLCERTPAHYYRIGTMRIDSLARYIGPATDYYMNGQPEMQATYNLKGDLDGDAVFYYPDGKIKMKGHFTQGKMTGQWHLYSSTGILRAVMDCKSETNFTPLFLYNKKGRPLLEDGSGKFTLETKEFEGLILPSGLEIDGEVRKGLKDGNWEYTTFYNTFFGHISRTHRVFLSEQYVRGRFIRGLHNPHETIDKRKIVTSPFAAITLWPPKLLTLDQLKADLVFAPTASGVHQLRSFLVRGHAPVIEEAPNSADQNFALFIRVICNALIKKEELAFKGFSSPGKTCYADSYPMIRPGQTVNKKDRYNASIRFTILPNRSVGNLTIDGKIDDRSRELITYYLLKLRKLYLDPGDELNKIVLTLQTTSNSGSNYLPVIQLSRPAQPYPDVNY
ncbi:hypothetical protein HNQ91_001684 [Filimonas zeae]|nr:hypothetical protein [Filimonas zeae]MDR6338633.1 hypothetical protein [Filimonas zeae]